MGTSIQQASPPLLPLPIRERSSRHEHRVRRYSVDYALLTDLRTVATDQAGARSAIAHACRLHEVPVPGVTFHGRRGPHTGYCLAPAWHVRITVGESAVRRWEQRKGRAWPEEGMIRLGTKTALGTIAHELGHHLVNQRERPGVAPHGKLWVGWFDTASMALVDWCRRLDLDLGGLPRFSTA